MLHRVYKVAIRRGTIFSFRNPVINRNDLSPALLETRNTRDYVRERVTNYRRLPQVQRRTLSSFSLSQSIGTIPGAFGEKGRMLLLSESVQNARAPLQQKFADN